MGRHDIYLSNNIPNTRSSYTARCFVLLPKSLFSCASILPTASFSYRLAARHIANVPGVIVILEHVNVSRRHEMQSTSNLESLSLEKGLF